MQSPKKNFGMISIREKKKKQYFDSADWSKEKKDDHDINNETNSNISQEHYSVGILNRARANSNHKSTLNREIDHDKL